ncbi:MAG: 5-formyltetrahydrofolate cyclo-ligase [Aeromonadaceae bacterium]
MQKREEIRQQIRSRRQAISPEQQLSASQNLIEQFKQHPLICRAQCIALYLATDGELDTHPVIDWCWQQNIRICLPVLHPFSQGHLLFLHYTPDSPMSRNRFGIAEPRLNCQQIVPQNSIDIICTPLVAFDQQGNRLGMGGGFYDRTLMQWHHQRLGPYPIGLAHDCQEVERVPTAHWDVPLPEILTPSRRLHWPS